MVATTVFLRGHVKPAAARQVYFTSDNGFESMAFRLVGEFLDPEKIPVIGDGNGLHAVFPGLLHQYRDTGSPVQD